MKDFSSTSALGLNTIWHAEASSLYNEHQGSNTKHHGACVQAIDTTMSTVCVLQNYFCKS